MEIFEVLPVYSATLLYDTRFGVFHALENTAAVALAEEREYGY